MTKRLLLLIAIILLAICPASAQQTIITIPSSDVLPFGDLIIKESNRINPIGDSNSYQITPTVIFGTGWGTETSVGFSTNLRPEKDAALRFDIATKKVFKIGNTTRFTLGGRISPYLNTEQSPDTFLFAHVTQKIPKTRTSITAGTYAGGKNRAPSSVGFLVGLDQVIIKNKLRLVMDYTSRDDSFGAYNVGVKYRPIPDLSITTAVSIPTNNYNNNVGFIVSFSKYMGNVKDIYDRMIPEQDEDL